jgi:hypothetical protein
MPNIYVEDQVDIEFDYHVTVSEFYESCSDKEKRGLAGYLENDGLLTINHPIETFSDKKRLFTGSILEEVYNLLQDQSIFLSRKEAITELTKKLSEKYLSKEDE